MIENNPFTSDIFKKIWCAQFLKHKSSLSFNFITTIAFYKPTFLSLYINIGKNLTKGISYVLNADEAIKDFKNKVYLIYDVPNYFNLTTSIKQKRLGLLKVKQYPGFGVQLENFTDLKNYLATTFSKSSLQKLNRYQRRLEQCFDIDYKMFYGAIEKVEYDHIFEHFKFLLTKRFDDKQITNNNLDPAEWEFYKEVVYPLILEKKASLYVIYNKQTPISIRLSYYNDNISFDAITTFDIDYAKFHLGKISILKILEWSFEKELKFFDFSKGYFDYKESWGTIKYDFEYHIYYDKKSFAATVLANSIAFLFKTKQFLRDKKLNEKLHQFTYLFKNKTSSLYPTIKDLSEEQYVINEQNLEEVTLNGDLSYLKKHRNDFLFLSSAHLNQVKVYKVIDANKNGKELVFLFRSERQQKLIAINS